MSDGGPPQGLPNRVTGRLELFKLIVGDLWKTVMTKSETAVAERMTILT